MAAAIRARFAPLGDVVLPEIPRAEGCRVDLIDPWHDKLAQGPRGTANASLVPGSNGGYCLPWMGEMAG